MSLHSLPIFVRLAGRDVILIGEGEMADAKRRLLERAGARIVGEDAAAALAIVVDDQPAAERLRARGVLVNAVDRPDLCDFTLPAIVERDPVIVAIGTGGASAGLAAMLRQRVEAWLPAKLGALASALHAARDAIKSRYPEFGDRRRAIGAALAAGGPLDPFGAPDVDAWLASGDAAPAPRVETVVLASGDPEELTLRAARLLALADRIYHAPDVPAAILDRARGDAARHAAPMPEAPGEGLTLVLEMAR